MDEKQYYIEFKTFMTNYKKGLTDAEDVGLAVLRMADYFVKANNAFARSDISFKMKCAEEEGKVDMNTGKPVSSTKAKVMAESSPDYGNTVNAETELKNIETLLQSLKTLQKGILGEFRNMN